VTSFPVLLPHDPAHVDDAKPCRSHTASRQLRHEARSMGPAMRFQDTNSVWVVGRHGRRRRRDSGNLPNLRQHQSSRPWSFLPSRRTTRLHRTNSLVLASTVLSELGWPNNTCDPSPGVGATSFPSHFIGWRCRRLGEGCDEQDGASARGEPSPSRAKFIEHTPPSRFFTTPAWTVVS
jgi:hypothetical protein